MPLDASTEYEEGTLLDRLCNLPLYWIIDKSGQRVLFRPNEDQLDFIQNSHGRDIILKCRQRGFTTLCCILYLDACMNKENTAAALIAHKLDDAKKIFRNKVKFVYDNLPREYRLANPLAKETADELTFENGSSFSVSTSVRSATVQYLHISEHGKICATQPDKAEEIKTGSFPAVPEGGRIVIESTAEGQAGDFFDLTEEARTRIGGHHHAKQFKFHFYPWWGVEEYRSDPYGVVITDADAKYFAKIEAEEGITFDDRQRAWYVLTEAEQGGKMRREYPSTPDEAFEQAIDGAYFSAQFLSAYKHGRIGEYPPQSTHPAHTFWDLGKNDCTAIWFMQQIGERKRLIGYYENSGESIRHYIAYVREWLSERDLVAGDHYWPHDGRRGDLFYEENQTRLTIAAGHRMRPKIVERVEHKMDAIEAARTEFVKCDFDVRGCTFTLGEKKYSGIQRLREYRKEWDKVRGVWRDKPYHGIESNGADAFMTMATGYKAPVRDTRRGSDRQTRQM